MLNSSVFEQTYPVSVSGSRECTDYYQIKQIMDHYKPWIKSVNNGGAKGVDSLVERWCVERQCVENNIPTYVFKPVYLNSEDRTAPLRRNMEIVRGTKYLIAFPSVKSRGTWDTIRKAESLGISYRIHRI